MPSPMVVALGRATADLIQAAGLTWKGKELRNPGYARARALFGLKGDEVVNLETATFPVATGAWGKADGFILCGEDGVQSPVYALEHEVTIGSLDQVYFPAGALRGRVKENA